MRGFQSDLYETLARCTSPPAKLIALTHRVMTVTVADGSDGS